MLTYVLRSQNRVFLTPESYRKIMGEVEICQRYIDLSNCYEVKLRRPFIVIEGGLAGAKGKEFASEQKQNLGPHPR